MVAEESSQLTLVESYVGGGGVHFTNAVTEIAAANDCRIDYNRVQLVAMRLTRCRRCRRGSAGAADSSATRPRSAES